MDTLLALSRCPPFSLSHPLLVSPLHPGFPFSRLLPYRRFSHRAAQSNKYPWLASHQPPPFRFCFFHSQPVRGRSPPVYSVTVTTISPHCVRTEIYTRRGACRERVIPTRPILNEMEKGEGEGGCRPLLHPSRHNTSPKPMTGSVLLLEVQYPPVGHTASTASRLSGSVRHLFLLRKVRVRSCSK